MYGVQSTGYFPRLLHLDSKLFLLELTLSSPFHPFVKLFAKSRDGTGFHLQRRRWATVYSLFSDVPVKKKKLPRYKGVESAWGESQG